MRLRHIVYACALFCFSAFVFVSPAQAEMRIAVVDLQKIMTESTVAKNLQEQVAAYREKSQSELNVVEQKLREEQKTLAESKDSLPPEEFASKKQAFEQSLAETRNVVQTKKRALDEAFAEAVGKMRDEVISAVDEISERDSYQLVVTRQNVVMVKGPFDITDEVMQKVNANLTEISLDIKEQ